MLRPVARLVTGAALLLSIAHSAAARDLYVAPYGSSIADGSFDHPLDLVTALAGSGLPRPGDTIWLRGGTYWGPFRSDLTGTATEPITVRQYPGERATLDGAPSTIPTLTVVGAYTRYWGFEITNSDPNRRHGQGSRGTGLDIYGPYTQFINLVVHDAETGIGFWTEAVGAVLYGNIIYNNGDEGPDRGHGHSIYVQNEAGTKLIANNILLNSFSYGIHAYTQAGRIDNLVFDGNIAFNHGLLSQLSGAKSDFLLGGGQVAHHAIITNNYTYYPGGVGHGADIGYQTACDEASITGNYFSGASAVNLTCTRTVFDANVTAGTTFGGITATYPGNSYSDPHPAGLQTFIRPNVFEPGRANIAVYNWDRLPQVAVDLSTARLTIGQTYEIRDAQNFYGTPVVVFTYGGGAVSIPMASGAITQPIGDAPLPAVDTKPEFGAFIVLPLAATPATLAASVIVSPSSVAQNRPAVLVWNTANAVNASLDQGIGSVAPSGFLTVAGTQTRTYTLTATGTTGSSATASATLTVAPNAPPLVSLTRPAPGLTYQAPVNLAMVADAQDTDGTVTEVTFYSGTTLLGSVATPPFAWALPDLAAGDYSLTAVALDNRGATTTSPLVTFTVVNAGAGATAAVEFVRTDTSTQGTWKGAYGSDGYALAADGTSYPGYASVAFSGAETWTWSRLNTSVRALQRAADASRFAAVWFSPTSFDIDVNVGDQTRQVALYTLDFDRLSRQQAIYVIDAATNRVLDLRIGSGFIDGQYWVWRLKGHVIFRLVRLLGANAVVSGVFFDTPSGGPAPPVVSLTSPAFGTSFTAPAAIPLAADATAAAGRTIDHVSFYAGTSLLGTATTVPYAVTWMDAPAGSYGITATATDSQGASTTSAPTTVIVRSAAGSGGGNAASFVRTDTTSQGSWRGRYGAEGYGLFAASTAYPTSVQVFVTGGNPWIWSGSTTDARALQRPGTASDRIAGTLYSAAGFTLDVNLLDGLTHQVALYALDFDGLGRQESIDVVDAVTGAVLDHRVLTGFGGGQYWIWQVTGHVAFRVSNLAGGNAVLSGLFFDAAGVGAPAGPPTLTLTNPTTFPATAPADVTLQAAVTSATGSIATVTFYDDGSPIGSASSPFTFTWASVTAGTHAVTAKATDAGGQTGTSNPLTVVVDPPSPGGGPPASGTSAVYLRTDATTKGNWNGAYGHDGFSLANGTASAPGYATVSFGGQSMWTWAASTTDMRGLQRPGSATDRFAAVWYSSTSFAIDLNLTDGGSHAIGFYVVDWDGLGRQQRIEIVDAATAAVLDTQTLSAFTNGVFLIWRISGHVVVRVTRMQGPNAVLSGFFFDAPGGGSTPGSTPPTITLTNPGSITAPAAVVLDADAQDVDATITEVKFFAGATEIGRATSPPWRTTWNVAAPGPYSLTATATNGAGQSTTSAALLVTVGGAPPAGGNSAVFVGFDTTTAGNWRSRYGTQGMAIASDANAPAPGVALAWAGYQSWVWTFSNEARAMQQAAGGGRIASTWFAGSSFTIDVNVADGVSHQLALYLLDWDNAGRTETIDLLDATTGVVLDSRSVSGFAGGQYALWRVSGQVTFRVTRTAGPNAVISALFVDP